MKAALLFSIILAMPVIAEESEPAPKSIDGKDVPPIEKLVLLKGNVKAGEAIFKDPKTANCVNCHRMGDMGKEVGPPLDSIGEKPKEVLFESILQPSAAIQHGFETYAIKTKDGVLLTGLLIEETEEHLLLRDATGEQIEIAPAKVLKKLRQEKSMMPEGLSGLMTLQELVDLVEFLASKRVGQ